MNNNGTLNLQHVNYDAFDIKWKFGLVLRWQYMGRFSISNDYWVGFIFSNFWDDHTSYQYLYLKNWLLNKLYIY